jgi:hypothetical protein
MAAILRGVGDWYTMNTGGFHQLNADYSRQDDQPWSGNFAYASYDSGETPVAPGERYEQADWRALVTGGWSKSYDHTVATLPEEPVGGPGSFAYAADELDSTDPIIPTGWPSGVSVPGPPWPPGWPITIAATYTLTVTAPTYAYVGNDGAEILLEAYLLNAAGNPAVEADGQVFRVACTIGGATVQVKPKGGVYANSIDVLCSQYDGTNYGFQDDIVMDVDNTNDGDTATLTVQSITTDPVESGTDTTEIVFAFAIAIGDGGVNPSTWDVADGTGVLPDLTGTYIRGATAYNLTAAGGRNHSHSWSAGATGTPNGLYAHAISNADFTPVYSSSAAVEATFAQHNHGATLSDNHSHTHTETFAPSADPVAHLPASRVIDWLAKGLGTTELTQYPNGAILGWYGDATKLPSNWVICDGTNGTPDLMSNFAIRASGAGTAGADTHVHAAAVTDMNNDAGHNHGGTITGTTGAGTVTVSHLSGAKFTTTDSHSHTISTNVAHKHSNSTSPASDSQDHKPPYRQLPYIMKTSSAAAGSDIQAKLHIMAEPSLVASAPTGWTKTHNIATGRLLVGYSSGDADFGSYGNVGATTHTHAGSLTVDSGGAHTHAIPTDVRTYAIAGALTVRGWIGHSHTLANHTGHVHAGATGACDSPSSTPASVNVEILKKT